MKALIDYDPIVYRIGFACQKKDEDGNIVPEPLSYALHSTKVFVLRCIKGVKADSYVGYLTGGGNFRSIVDTMYKMNRKDNVKPIHYQAIRDYLVNRYKGIVIEGFEADDALAMMQTEDTTICTIDKDLKMVAGCHFNYVTKEFVEVNQEEGTWWFYAQMLMGDAVDNIAGIKRLGIVKATELLADTTREDWDSLVMEQYEIFHKKAVKMVKGFTEEEKLLQKNYDYVAFANYSPFQRMCMNAMLLWMCQKTCTMPIDFKELMDSEHI